MSNVTDQIPNSMVVMTRKLRAILENPGDGIVAMVDSLLTNCADYRVEVEFREDIYQGEVLDARGRFTVESSIPKPVLRAIIARVAALCNEQTPHAVSPYGGEGELTVSAKPGALLKAVFVNTTDQQHLTLTTLRTATEVPDGTEIVSEATAAEARKLVPIRS